MKAEDFIKKHFPGIEKETWYPAIAAIAEGYGKHILENLQGDEKRIQDLQTYVLQLATLLSRPQIKFFLSQNEIDAIMQILKTIKQ